VTAFEDWMDDVRNSNEPDPTTEEFNAWVKKIEEETGRPYYKVTDHLAAFEAGRAAALAELTEEWGSADANAPLEDRFINRLPSQKHAEVHISVMNKLPNTERVTVRRLVYPWKAQS
jgi:endonuclease/exonuclease/phosphatase family metal-dependent hydrolase